MHTGSPKASRIATMVLFALSCIGLLLFLWLSFGGTIPLESHGYRFQVAIVNDHLYCVRASSERGPLCVA